ncbi:MAG: phytanoyl-CoA dioxygenase family protein [bacterium]|nr:phytanoyl-CoA dioxygenase family protein [bacterium]
MNTINLYTASLDKELEERGYIVLKSFLNKEAIDGLLNYYQEIGLNSEKTQPNYLYANPALSKEISATIKSHLAKDFDKAFKTANLLGGVFMVKKPGEHKEVDFHQDWSLVEESKHTSYNLWCPLVGTSQESGSLMLMEKSDKAGLFYRSATLDPLEIKFDTKYEPFISSFDLNAGDAILYKHSLFHGSGNNSSAKDRIAIACGIIPENADFIYQNWNQEKSVIESYKVDNDFYIDHIFEVLSGKIPAKYQIIAETPFVKKPVIDESIFYKRMRKLHNLKRFFFFD